MNYNLISIVKEETLIKKSKKSKPVHNLGLEEKYFNIYTSKGYQAYVSKVREDNIKIELNNLDFKYYVEYTYDTDYDCENYGCNSEGICRCSVLTNLKCTRGVLREDIFQFIKQLNFIDNKTYYLEFFLDRLYSIFKLYDADNFNVTSCGGYYGEEIDSVTLKDSTPFANAIIFYHKNFDNLGKLIYYLIELEYDYIHPKLVKKTFSFIEVDIENIIPNNKEYYKKNNKGGTINYNVPSCLCIPNGNKAEILDGYHRYHKAIKDKKEKLLIVLAN